MLIASTGSNPTPFGFVGGSQYQTDADSGLMLLGHRYYDASIGRFISRDPIYAGDFPLPLFPRFARRGREPGMHIVRIIRWIMRMRRAWMGQFARREKGCAKEINLCRGK